MKTLLILLITIFALSFTSNAEAGQRRRPMIYVMMPQMSQMQGMRSSQPQTQHRGSSSGSKQGMPKITKGKDGKYYADVRGVKVQVVRGSDNRWWVAGQKLHLQDLIQGGHSGSHSGHR